MKIKINTLSILILILVNFQFVFSLSQDSYLSFKAKKGDKLDKILRFYHLPVTKDTKQKFAELNKKKIDEDFQLLYGVKYFLPIYIVESQNLTKFLKDKVPNEDLEVLKQRILNYTKLLRKQGVAVPKSTFLIPYNYLSAQVQTVPKEEKKEVVSKAENVKSKENFKLFKPYYGKKYQKVKVKSRILKNCAFYLVSGHGGPDPGAIGYFEGKELDEDEYAYDITLRLARHLEENGATVYMITIDTVDGIRDDKFLETSNREVFYGGVTIPLNQKERLQTCADIVNKLYKSNRNKKKHNISINIHLDSRSETEKVDVFFYYQEQSSTSKQIAITLQKTLEEQYEKHQPGRGYSGTVETRNLFMLKNSLPPTVYIELGNIRNRSNQYRFIDNTNREALAKWLCLGLINFIKDQQNKK
jgi:N-acetylmuramoyl-L-alanine amidase